MRVKIIGTRIAGTHVVYGGGDWCEKYAANAVQVSQGRTHASIEFDNGMPYALVRWDVHTQKAVSTKVE
jgi:hypothetical protein